MKSFKYPLIALIVLLLLGVIFEVSLNAYIQLTIIFMITNMVLAMSLNLVNGFTGQFSLGNAGFMAVGAYSSAYLSTFVPMASGPLQFFNLILYAIGGGLCAAVAGFIVGQPSLRLKGDYLAIVTLGFGEIIRVVLLNTPAVGGARGFYGIPGATSWQIGPLTVDRFLVSYAHAVLWLLICFFVIWRTVRSKQGRAFLSVREDEIAAESMGINTTQTKVRAFVMSSFFAGVAGSIFAHYTNYLNPSSFTFGKSVDSVIMFVLGGMGSLSGSVLAAVFITVVPEVLRPLQDITGVDLRMVIYSVSLILLMILRPKGLFGSAELPQIWRKYVRKSS